MASNQLFVAIRGNGLQRGRHRDKLVIRFSLISSCITLILIWMVRRSPTLIVLERGFNGSLLSFELDDFIRKSLKQILHVIHLCE